MTCHLHDYLTPTAQTASLYGGSSPSYPQSVRFDTHKGRVYGYGYSNAQEAYAFSFPQKQPEYGLSSSVPFDCVLQAQDCFRDSEAVSLLSSTPITFLSPSFSAIADQNAVQDLLTRITAERMTLGGLEQSLETDGPFN